MELIMFSFFLLFRILNKLSPEKFDKLSLELLNVGINTQIILKGVILLVSCFFVIIIISHYTIY